jgi:hypothetical protein
MTGDEGRPTCRNCINKELECRYAAPFQILSKNNYTPEVKQKFRYENVQVCCDLASQLRRFNSVPD